MIEHRVGALNVKLATRGAPAELAGHARSFAQQLVEAVAERLEARARGRVVVIRRLPVRLRARQELLLDRGELERLADELATAITWGAESPAWTDDVAVFDDEIAWHAAFLCELARTRNVAWCFAELAARPDCHGGLATLPEATLAAVLDRVHRAGALEAVLERMPREVVEAVAVQLGIASAAKRPHGEETPIASSFDEARLFVRAIRDHMMRAPSAISTIDIRATDSEPVEQVSRAAVHVTERGGLVYLVRCLLELDAGEILWRACVPEQQVITAALAQTIDIPGDPAPALLGGGSPEDGFAASPDQRAEIVEALCASLHAALPRRGLASRVDVVVRVVETERGRVLCAVAADLPIFAAPAPSAADERSAMNAFLRAWPAGAVDAPCEDATLQLREDLGLDAALIASVTAGCAATLLRARTHELALAARAGIHDDGDVRIVTMPLEAIRIAVRKAGLDRDPGWVPWLQRHVRIVFEETLGTSHGS